METVVVEAETVVVEGAAEMKRVSATEKSVTSAVRVFSSAALSSSPVSPSGRHTCGAMLASILPGRNPVTPLKKIHLSS